MTLNAEIQLLVRGNYTRAAGIGQSLYDLSGHALGRYILTLADGVGVGQADKAYASHPTDGLTLAGAASQSFDLSGTTDDALGVDLALVTVKAFILMAWPVNVDDLIIGNGATPFLGWFGAAAHTEAVAPGAITVHVHPGAGWPVVPGVSDILKITNADTVEDASYDMVILGTSA